MIWKNRYVKIEEGMIMASREGDHDNFDFAPAKLDGKEAFALKMAGEASALALLNGDLIFRAGGEMYRIVGSSTRSMIVKPLEKSR